MQFGAVWTWSKAMDFTDTYNGAVAMYASLRQGNYGEAGHDHTHNVAINWLYDIPGVSRYRNNRLMKGALDGWQISGTASFISGTPCSMGLSGTASCGSSNPTSTFTTVDGADITGGDGARVVLTGNPVLPGSQRTLYRFFDTNVVARPAKGTIGKAPKTSSAGGTSTTGT